LPTADLESQPDNNTTDGPATVCTLEKLNFPAASAVYVPLKDGEIRLATIHRGIGDDPITCSLAHANENELPPYEAFSYVCV
jgi:hypothetical protein